MCLEMNLRASVAWKVKPFEGGRAILFPAISPCFSLVSPSLNYLTCLTVEPNLVTHCQFYPGMNLLRTVILLFLVIQTKPLPFTSLHNLLSNEKVPIGKSVDLGKVLYSLC